MTRIPSYPLVHPSPCDEVSAKTSIPVRRPRRFLLLSGVFLVVVILAIASRSFVRLDGRWESIHVQINEAGAEPPLPPGWDHWGQLKLLDSSIEWFGQRTKFTDRAEARRVMTIFQVGTLAVASISLVLFIVCLGLWAHPEPES
jgi:hypothetical protein